MLQHDRGSDLLGAHLASDFAPGVHCAGKNIFQTAQKYLRYPKNICTCQVVLLVLLVVGGAVAGAVYFKYHKRWAACRGILT